jgi:hypothetical protein
MPSNRKPSTTRLSEDELLRVVELAGGSDSIELKLTVPPSTRRAVGAALGADPLDGQIRQVYFFDTPDLTLAKAGLVVRARRVQGKGDDSVVKLRPVVPHELPKKLWDAAGFGVEVDAMPGGYVCSASMKSAAQGDVRQTLSEAGPLRNLFSEEQRAFYADYAPDGIGLDDLSVLGPILVLKLKFTPEDLRRRLVAELWLYPDNSRILELSTKCAPAESFQVATEVRVFLMERGVDLSGEQETKTKKALEFFSEQLQHAPA